MLLNRFAADWELMMSMLSMIKGQACTAQFKSGRRTRMTGSWKEAIPNKIAIYY